jgi:hypothetical protein
VIVLCPLLCYYLLKLLFIRNFPKSRTADLTPADENKTTAAILAKLSPLGHKLAEVEKYCAQADNPLGAMGVPVKIMLKSQPVFLCFKGCVEKVQKNLDKTLAKVKELKENAGQSQ